MVVILGKCITRNAVAGAPIVESIPTSTLRLALYKDQWPDDWTSFTQRPFRALLEKFPLLQLCTLETCGEDCRFYHAPVDEPLDHLILDLWNRSWLNSTGKYTKPHEAHQWSALVRVPASAQKSLQALSGAFGWFWGSRFEPRSSSESSLF